jgi:hypothetical protein
MPTNNDTVVCPEDLNSCYFLYRTSSTYSASTSECSALGGTPVQWNTAYEQQAIESYFKVQWWRQLWQLCMPGMPAESWLGSSQCHRGLVGEDLVGLLLRRPPAAWASTGLR